MPGSKTPLESRSLDQIKNKAKKLGIRLTKKNGSSKTKQQLITAIRKRRGMSGDGKFTDALKKGWNWLKQNKVISKGLNSLGGVIPGQLGMVASQAGKVADQLGLGKSRKYPGQRKGRRGGRMVGGAILI